MITIKTVQYNIGNPRKLKHKRRNILEIIASLIMQSHVCQVCRRKELWSVSGWTQIDDKIYKDKDDCSVVCDKCVKSNPEVFDFTHPNYTEHPDYETTSKISFSNSV